MNSEQYMQNLRRVLDEGHAHTSESGEMVGRTTRSLECLWSDYPHWEPL